MTDLKLNSISRYAKRSSRLVLEAHDHCEVPAGCGGVVLRWRNPNQGLPLTFRVYAAGASQFFLDGKLLSSARPIVPPGEHVVSLIIRGCDPRQALLLCAASFEDKTDGTGYEERSRAILVHFLSAPDDSWKYVCADPNDPAWQNAGYDDSRWSTMEKREWPQDKERTKNLPNVYRAEQLLKMGAQGLSIIERASTVWVRRRFSVRANA